MNARRSDFRQCCSVRDLPVVGSIASKPYLLLHSSCRYVKELFQDAGLKIHEDPMGNIFGRWEGTDTSSGDSLQSSNLLLESEHPHVAGSGMMGIQFHDLSRLSAVIQCVWRAPRSPPPPPLPFPRWGRINLLDLFWMNGAMQAGAIKHSGASLPELFSKVGAARRRCVFLILAACAGKLGALHQEAWEGLTRLCCTPRVPDRHFNLWPSLGLSP